MTHAQVLQRAIDVGVGLLIAFTTDFEKGDLLMKLARENSGETAVGMVSLSTLSVPDRPWVA